MFASFLLQGFSGKVTSAAHAWELVFADRGRSLRDTTLIESTFMFTTSRRVSARRVRQCALCVTLLVLLSDVARAAYTSTPQVLTASDAVADTRLGGHQSGPGSMQMATAGDWLVASAPLKKSEKWPIGCTDSCRNSEGAFYIYRKSTSGWVEHSVKRIPDDVLGSNMQYFGTAVNISPDATTICVGMTNYGSSYGGFFIYTRDQSDDTWSPSQTFKAVDYLSTFGDFLRLGNACAVDGDHMIVGAYSTGHNGKLLFFKRDSSGVWAPTQTFTKAYIGYAPALGSSVALSGTIAVAGALNEHYYEPVSSGGSNVEFGGMGDALVYEYTNGAWALASRVAPPKAPYYSYLNANQRPAGYTHLTAQTSGWKYGFSSAVRGAYAAFGAPYEDNTGRVYVWKRSDGGTWSNTQELVGSQANGWFGFSVAFDLDAERLIVGAPNSGKAFTYIRSGEVWSLDASLSSGTSFGSAVAISPTYAFVSEPNYDDGSIQKAGALYFYAPSTCAANERVSGGSCVACDPEYSNAAGDDLMGSDTDCGECAANHYANSGTCVACPTGSENAAGDDVSGADTTCTCPVDYFVNSGTCVACPTGSENAAGDDVSGADTTCTCPVDYFVNSGICSQCPTNSENAAGNDVNGGADTTCACLANFFVDNGACLACPGSLTNAAGDLISDGDTACDGDLCAADQYVLNHRCASCASGYSRDAGDDKAGADTTCDTCEQDYFVANDGTCTQCPSGSTNAAGDNVALGATSCACPQDYFVDNGACLACPGSLTNAAGDLISDGDTACDGDLCAADQYVLNHRCASCASGYSRSAGDDKAGADTTCDTCAQDHYVDAGACVACPTGTTKATGDNVTLGNTACDGEVCGEDEYVSGYRCVACAAGYSRAAGDLKNGTDTTCDADPPPPVAASPPDADASSYVEASLDLTGYTAATFTDAVQTTFRTGVATLLDVDLSGVVIVSVSDVSSSRRRRLMQASSGAVRVTFRVTASASQLSSISSQLSSASSSGALLSALQTAGLSNATGLSLQSVDAVYESESARRAALAKDAIAGIAAGSSAFAILVFLCMRRNAKRRAARVQQIIASQGGPPQGAHGRGYQPFIVHVAPNAAASNAQTVDAIALQRANSAARQAARKDAMDRQKQRIERQLRK